MLLNGKVAAIYGAGGGAVARTFAREGAKVSLSGRNVASVEAVCRGHVAAGGEADAARSMRSTRMRFNTTWPA